MLRDEGGVVESTWAAMAGSAVVRRDERRRKRHVDAAERAADAREIDHQLRQIAKRKAGLEIEQARWLRQAERQRIWRTLGFSTSLEYLEEAFGYSPRTAMDRLRVAKELGALPALEAAVEGGELPYSAARELTRVMTRDTEAAWLARARGKNLRDIEELVAGRTKGDTPDAPKKPELVRRKRTLELSPRVNAMVEQCRAVLADELGCPVDDDVLIEAMCRSMLVGDGDRCARGGDEAEAEGRAADRTSPAKAPRPVHRIVIYQCESCSRAAQQSRGRTVELTAAELALATCDGETVRPSASSAAPCDGETVQPSASSAAPCDGVTVQPSDRSAPERATSNIPQRIRNRVWARDKGRCRVPGCRASRHLDIHHIVHRSAGGDHDPSNLIVLCSGHHKLHHDGVLAIRGRAPDRLTFVRDGKVLVDARSPDQVSASAALRERVGTNKLAEVTRREHAKQALVKLGFKARAASALLDDVRAHVGSDADAGALVTAALARGAVRPPADEEEPVKDARQALVQLGFSSSVATAAVDKACARVGSQVALLELIKEALRGCQ